LLGSQEGWRYFDVHISLWREKAADDRPEPGEADEVSSTILTVYVDCECIHFLIIYYGGGGTCRLVLDNMLRASVVHFGRNSVAEGPRIVTQWQEVFYLRRLRNVLLSSFFM